MSEKRRRAAISGSLPENIHISKDTSEQIILMARNEKKCQLLAKNYWAKVDKQRELTQFSQDEMYQLFIERASRIIKKEFIIDQYNEQVIKLLCMYFTGHKDAEKHGLSLSKGILLMGERGTGKSVIMKAFSSNQHQSYMLVNVRLVTYDFAEHGFKVVKNFSTPETIPMNHYGQELIGCCFDDLGTDEERKHFGDKVNAIGEILLNRYDSVEHKFTHITTNLNANAIEQFYGPRLRSRFREMFNVISFDAKAPDRRK
ncbi:MAG: hypothetical protein KGZ82_04380 [Bacteroidales bacterium]|nr:hypothetical protein [Bacteroidales bacterium]